ncbi:Hypothetical protein A7982_00809 [Minicystis rosea]|nr:Hypothetical protein A7982_00809 [Minicystis rosea]
MTTGLVDGTLLRAARVRVHLDAADDTGIVRLGYALNGAAEVEAAITPGPNATADLDLTPTRGANELVLFAEDAAGNRAEVTLHASLERHMSAGGSHTGAVVNGNLLVWGATTSRSSASARATPRRG